MKKYFMKNVLKRITLIYERKKLQRTNLNNIFFPAWKHLGDIILELDLAISEYISFLTH